MTDIQIIAFGTLWLFLMLLGALVLLLYRQVEQSQNRRPGWKLEGYLGKPAAEVEVVTDEGTAILNVGERPGLTLLFFVSTACDSCKRLLPLVAKMDLDCPRLLLVEGEGRPSDLPREYEPYWLAHAADLVNTYGVTSFPSAVVVENGVVRSAGFVESESDIVDLFRRANDVQSTNGRHESG